VFDRKYRGAFLTTSSALACPLLFGLLTFPTVEMAGTYKVADAWQTGIHSHWSQMDKEDLPLCSAVEKAVASFSPLEHELSCKGPFYQSSAIVRPMWADLEKARMLPVAKRLETLIEAWSGREAPWVESVPFTAQAAARIAAGGLTISLATVTVSDMNMDAAPSSEQTTLLRYQRYDCAEPVNYIWGTHGVGNRIVYFVVGKTDLSDLQMLATGSEETDVFLFHESAYFDSLSSELISKRQVPEIMVQKLKMLDDKKWLVQACSLLYRENKTSTKGKTP
jgi:hypothetical protein